MFMVMVKGMLTFCVYNNVSVNLLVISRSPYLITTYHYGIAIYQGLLTIFVIANFGFATFMDPGVYSRGILRVFMKYCNISFQILNYGDSYGLHINIISFLKDYTVLFFVVWILLLFKCALGLVLFTKDVPLPKFALL